MRLSSRLKRLEKDRGADGRRRCKCKGAQPPCGVYYDDDPKPEVAERICATCGGVMEPLLIHVVYDRKIVEQPESALRAAARTTAAGQMGPAKAAKPGTRKAPAGAGAKRGGA